jgi:hypothetical protein
MSHRQIDELYLDEAQETFAYWERNPPTYQMVSIIAQMLGWKRPVGEAPPLPTLTAAEAAAIGKAAGLPGPVATSFEDMKARNLARMVEIAKRNAAKGLSTGSPP